jgi:hypothetical protein
MKMTSFKSEKRDNNMENIYAHFFATRGKAPYLFAKQLGSAI